MSWFKRKKIEEEPKVCYRIIKETWPDGHETFSIETYDSWLGDDMFWHSLMFNTRPNTFPTHKEASDYLTEYLKPPVRPIMTVVEER